MKILVGEDATAYAKLLMSVYLFGNNAAYDGDCGRVGGISSFHCARDRYGFQIIRRPDKDRTGKSVMVSDFRTPEQVEAAPEEGVAGSIRSSRREHNRLDTQLQQASPGRVHGPVQAQQPVLLPLRSEARLNPRGGPDVPVAGFRAGLLETKHAPPPAVAPADAAEWSRIIDVFPALPSLACSLP